MRIGIVNDMRMTVELLRRIVVKIPGCEVAWVAADGLEAVEKCVADTPDMVIMDIRMPVLDGVGATRRIMRECPCAILVVTATVGGYSSEVFKALGEGALDVVSTPLVDADAPEGGDQELVRKIRMFKKLVGGNRNGLRRRLDGSGDAGESCELVVIGASTGGPKAVGELLSAISPDTSAAFVVIQHIDSQFADGFASWLASSCRLRVRVAMKGDMVERGTVLVAGTDDHMVMLPDLSLDYDRKPEENPFRPSVDVFFNSVAAVWPRRGGAVLLTGIGRDGAEGLLRLRRAGWRTFAQDKDSCVVFGMPRTAIELGAADEVLCPEAIGARLEEMYTNKRRG